MKDAFDLLAKQVDSLDEKVEKRLDKLEEKVDTLINYRFYFSGVAAAVGAIFGSISAVVIAWISGHK